MFISCHIGVKISAIVFSFGYCILISSCQQKFNTHNSGVFTPCGEIRLTLFKESDTIQICINVNELFALFLVMYIMRFCSMCV